MRHRYFRPGAIVGHVIVLAAALTCLRLGWWQWGVYEQARGTAQNLGYSLLWPVFSVSFIYMWLKFLQLEDEHGRENAGDQVDIASSGGADDNETDKHDLTGDDVADVRSARGQRHRTTISPRHTRATHTRTVGVGTVGDDDDDAELAAYNAALARLAEQEQRRGR